jgi:hypothetical protein
MFHWIRNLLSRRASRRDIFTYHDGHQARSIDPWAALLDLWTDPEHDINLVLAGSARGEPEAQRQLEAMVRRVFAIPEFDPATQRGLTILELHELHARFSRYIRDLKKKLATPPTRSRPTGSESLETPGDSTTRQEPDSCSTAGASNSDAPT